MRRDTGGIRPIIDCVYLNQSFIKNASYFANAGTVV